MEVTTEKVATFVDKSEWNGVIVRHVYRTDEDGRRTTAFYFCGNQAAADALASALKSASVR